MLLYGSGDLDLDPSLVRTPTGLTPEIMGSRLALIGLKLFVSSEDFLDDISVWLVSVFRVSVC